MTTGTIRGVLIGVLSTAAALGPGSAHAAGVSGQGTWETTLLPRDLDGNVVNGPEAFYDTALNITWLRNANAVGGTSSHGAAAWANSLVIGGVGGWRLPEMLDTGLPGCNLSNFGTDCGNNVRTAGNELAHLWHVTLGNKSFFDTLGNGPQPGWSVSNDGGFQYMQKYGYWYGTPYAPDLSDSWFFDTGMGSQNHVGNGSPLFVIAVRSGDVAAIPEPQTYAMMLLGIGGLLLAVRRRQV